MAAMILNKHMRGIFAGAGLGGAAGPAIKNWHFHYAHPAGGRRTFYGKLQLRHWPLTGDWVVYIFGERFAQGKTRPLVDCDLDLPPIVGGGGGGGGGYGYTIGADVGSAAHGGGGGRGGRPVKILIRKSFSKDGVCAYGLLIGDEIVPEINLQLGDGDGPADQEALLPVGVTIKHTRRGGETGGGLGWVEYECVTTLKGSQAGGAVLAAEGVGIGGSSGYGDESVGGGFKMGAADDIGVGVGAGMAGMGGGMGGSNGSTFVTYHRYSDFLQLDKDLRAAFRGSHLMSSFPLLPKRNPVVTDPFNRLFVEERMHTLEIYINRIIGMPKLRVNMDLVKFLGTPQGGEAPWTTS